MIYLALFGCNDEEQVAKDDQEEVENSLRAVVSSNLRWKHNWK